MLTGLNLEKLLRPGAHMKHAVPKWVWLTISWFGISGWLPFMRGTWGTLAALPFAFVVQWFSGGVGLAVAGSVLFVLGVYASNIYVRLTGRQDPGEIVIDEVAAVFFLLAYLPLTWQAYLAAFVVFRIFDIFKPWPVSLADQYIKGGFGVMVDDVLAALYPVLMVYVVWLIFPVWMDGVLAWLQLK